MFYEDGGYQGTEFQQGLRRACQRADLEILKRSDVANGFTAGAGSARRVFPAPGSSDPCPDEGIAAAGLAARHETSLAGPQPSLTDIGSKRWILAQARRPGSSSGRWRGSTDAAGSPRIGSASTARASLPVLGLSVVGSKDAP